MKFDDALSALGRQMNVAALAFNDAGVCRMVFDRELVVDCERVAGSDEAAWLYAVVASLPAEREAVLMRLLEANLFGAETGDASLAIDSVMSEILLQQKVDTAAMDDTAFAAAVERFVHVLECWREELAAMPSGGAADGLSHALPGEGMMRV